MQDLALTTTAAQPASKPKAASSFDKILKKKESSCTLSSNTADAPNSDTTVRLAVTKPANPNGSTAPNTKVVVGRAASAGKVAAQKTTASGTNAGATTAPAGAAPAPVTKMDVLARLRQVRWHHALLVHKADGDQQA